MIREPVVPESGQLVAVEDDADDLMSAQLNGEWGNVLARNGYSIDALTYEQVDETIAMLRKAERLTAQKITSLYIGRCWEATGHHSFLEFAREKLPVSPQTAYRKIRGELTRIWFATMYPDIDVPEMSERMLVEFSRLPAQLRGRIYKDCDTALKMVGSRTLTSRIYEMTSSGLVTQQRRLSAALKPTTVPSEGVVRQIDDTPIHGFVPPEREIVEFSADVPLDVPAIVAWYAAAICAIMDDLWGDTTFDSVDTPFTSEELAAIANQEAHQRLMGLIASRMAKV
jgi:hypothetical protein